MSSAPPPRPTSRPSIQHSSSQQPLQSERPRSGSSHSSNERPRQHVRSESSSPHPSTSSGNGARRSRPEITIISAQPMSTHPAFADGRKGGYVPPEAPPSYDDAIKSSSSSLADTIQAPVASELPAYTSTQSTPNLQQHFNNSHVDLNPPNPLQTSTHIPRPRIRRNIGNTNNNNNLTENILPSATTSNSDYVNVPTEIIRSQTQPNLHASHLESVNHSVSSTKPVVPNKPKIPRKPSSLQHHNHSIPHNSHAVANDNQQNKITKRVTVNPELSNADIENQEEFYEKKKRVIERLKHLKEQNYIDIPEEKTMATSDQKSTNDELLNLFAKTDETKSNRKLPPPPRPPTVPTPGAKAQKSFFKEVENLPSSSETNITKDSTDNILINFNLDDDPYASIDYNNMQNQPNTQMPKNMSNVDLLLSELGGIKPADTKYSEVVENATTGDSAPVPAPRKTQEKEDVYAIVCKPIAKRKSKKVSEIIPSEDIGESPPPVPMSRPPASDYSDLSDDEIKKEDNNPVIAPLRTKKNERKSSNASKQSPARPPVPPLPKALPIAPKDHAVVYYKSKEVANDSTSPPQNATVILRKSPNVKKKEKGKSFKLNRKSLGFFTGNKKDSTSSSSNSSLNEIKTKPSPKLRPKSTIVTDKRNSFAVAKPNNRTAGDVLQDNKNFKKAPMPKRTAPPRPTRPAPPKPIPVSQKNNNNGKAHNAEEDHPPAPRPRSKSAIAKGVSTGIQTERMPPPRRPAPVRSKSMNKPKVPPPAKITKETQTVTFELAGENLSNNKDLPNNEEQINPSKNAVNMNSPKTVVDGKTKSDMSSKIIQNSELAKPIGKVCAHFDYQSKESGDLCFNHGDVILVLDEINVEWFKGKLGDKVGIFPKAYVGELKALKPSRPSLPIQKSIEQKHLSCDPTTPDWGDNNSENETDWNTTELDDVDTTVNEEVNIHNPKQTSEEMAKTADLINYLDNQLGEIIDGEDIDDHLETPEDEFYSAEESEPITNTVHTKLAVAIFAFEGENDDELYFQPGNMITIIEQVNEEWLKGEFKGKAGIFPANFVQEIKDP